MNNQGFIENKFTTFNTLLMITTKVLFKIWQAKFPDGGSVLGSSQFSILPQLSLKTTANLN